MRKKLASLALVFILVSALLAGCAGGGSASGSGAEDTYTVKMTLLGNQEPADLAKIEEKVNEILVPAINMKLDVEVLGFGAYQQQIPLMLSGGDKVDLVPVITNYAGTFVSQKQVVDLKPLLDQYGENIKKYIGEDISEVANLGGFVYGIPTTTGWFTQSGLTMREDWLEEAGFKAEDIKSIDDMEEVFAAVKANHPDAIMYVPIVAMEDGRLETTDSLSDFNGVILDYGQDTTISNFYDSDEYNDYVTRMYNWSQKGWISKDAATNAETPSSLVKAGSAFCFPAPQSPGLALQETINTGLPITCIPLYESFITTAGTTYLTWSIAQNSENAEKAMQCLDFLYGNADIMNLLNWGIEGEHYVNNDDGTIGFADGLDATTSGYYLNQGWLLPNQFIGKIWEGQSPTMWEDISEINNSSQKSKAYGFRFDSTAVANQIAAISSVKGEYRAALNSGSVNPEEVLPKYLAALEEAGMSEVIAEKQAQFDAWLATQ